MYPAVRHFLTKIPAPPGRCATQTGTVSAITEIDTLYTPNAMNIIRHDRTYADLATVPSELSFRDCWDGEAVSDLIRSKTADGETPAFLFLGRREAAMLREHLAEIFGEESVVTLKGTYYKGLDVVTIDCDSFLATGGRKAIRPLRDPIVRRPAWRDEDSESLWRLRL
jgi:hypothetical protein